MKKYEMLYIIDKDVTDENREVAMQLVENTITEGNGVVSKVDKWGMKKFAYPINYKNEGYYVLVEFEVDQTVLPELERRMKVSDSFVRYMITAVIENKISENAKTAKKPERRERRPRFEEAVKVEETVKAEEVVAEAVQEVETKEVETAVEA